MALTRITVRSGPSSIEEQWVAETKQEMLDALEHEQRRWPPQGYGTDLYRLEQDPTGLLWQGKFVRYLSCD